MSVLVRLHPVPLHINLVSLQSRRLREPHPHRQFSKCQPNFPTRGKASIRAETVAEPVSIKGAQTLVCLKGHEKIKCTLRIRTVGQLFIIGCFRCLYIPSFSERTASIVVITRKPHIFGPHIMVRFVMT